MQEATAHRPDVARTGRQVLTRALHGIRNDDVQFGRGTYRHVTYNSDTSCLLGIVAWAADPSYYERDPFVMHTAARRAAREALEAIAAVLFERGDLPPYPTNWPRPGELSDGLRDERLEPLSLVAIGEWSDDQPSALPVLEVLEAALERAS